MSAKIFVNPVRTICLKAVQSDHQVMERLFPVDANTDNKRMKRKDLGHEK